MSETSFEDKNAHAESVQENSAGADQLSLFVNLDGFEGPIDLLLSVSREQ